MPVDLVIMALGNASNPIIKDSEPDLKTTKWGTINVDGGSQKTSLEDVYSGGDATRGGSTAINAAGDGQAAAREIVGDIPFSTRRDQERVDTSRALHGRGRKRPRPFSRRSSSPAASSSSPCTRR